MGWVSRSFPMFLAPSVSVVPWNIIPWQMMTGLPQRDHSNIKSLDVNLLIVIQITYNPSLKDYQNRLINYYSMRYSGMTKAWPQLQQKCFQIQLQMWGSAMNCCKLSEFPDSLYNKGWLMDFFDKKHIWHKEYYWPLGRRKFSKQGLDENNIHRVHV